MSYGTNWPILSDSTRVFKVAPRVWRGQMCGVRIPGLPPVEGGADDPSLVLSWFYDRYQPSDRARIRLDWMLRGYTHVALSWPDAQAAGATPESFRDICLELIDAEFYPCVFWCSKAFDVPDVPSILANIEQPLALLIGILPLACIGWELSLWLSPTQVQQLIDAIAPRLTPSGCRVYVHFQEGYSSFQQPGGIFADFWALQVGKLTGILHQKVLAQDPTEYYYASGGLVDVLQRFAGNFFCPFDSGFGHPFDLVAYELTAMPQFNGDCTEHEGDIMGTWATQCPQQSGVVNARVMGSGNGTL